MSAGLRARVEFAPLLRGVVARTCSKTAYDAAKGRGNGRATAGSHEPEGGDTVVPLLDTSSAGNWQPWLLLDDAPVALVRLRAVNPNTWAHARQKQQGLHAIWKQTSLLLRQAASPCPRLHVLASSTSNIHLSVTPATYLIQYQARI